MLWLLFDTADFPARWHCGNWSSVHGWTHIASDVAIFLAYVSIPVLLAFYVRLKRVAFPSIAWLFVAFILSCGIGHLVESTIFWHPWYRLSAAVKLITALVSWATVVAMVRAAPKIMALPGLVDTNRRLREEIRERERAEELLQESQRQLRQHSTELEIRNRELDQFAYAASHDLKAPLRGIANLAQWISEDATQMPEKSERHLELLLRRVARMEQLLDDLLAYSRAGAYDTQPQRIDPAECVQAVVKLLEPPESFTISVESTVSELTTPKVPLEQCLRNLIDNAIKHHDRTDGRIQIACHERDDCVVFSVEDDGPGIAPAYHERIFEIFKTLKSRDVVEGSGIGLALVSRIAESVGGTIAIDSVVGKGTTFHLTWPKTVGSEKGRM